MASREISLRSELTVLTPRLRRYARALVSGGAAHFALADDLVHATLMRALGARQLGLPSDLIIRLFATVTQLNRDMALVGRQARAAGAGRPNMIAVGPNFAPRNQTNLSASLLNLELEAREALLLVGLEGFDYGDAARILRVSKSVLLGRLTEARTEMAATLGSSPHIPRRQRVPYLRLVT